MILNEDELILNKSNVTIAWGMHFLRTFKEPLRLYFHDHQQELASACFGNLQSVTNLKIQVVLDFVTNDSNSRTTCVFQ